MNIHWDQIGRRFVAEFTDFGGDQPAVKIAGFRTDGAPGWIWWTAKAEVIDKLRKNRPPSGLQITDEALAEYKRLSDILTKNKETKKLFEKAKKAAKPIVSWIREGEIWLSKEDLPPYESPKNLFIPQHKAALVSDTRCALCGEPTYEPIELPYICLWCEKVDEELFILKQEIV